MKKKHILIKDSILVGKKNLTDRNIFLTTINKLPHYTILRDGEILEWGENHTCNVTNPRPEQRCDVFNEDLLVIELENAGIVYSNNKKYINIYRQDIEFENAGVDIRAIGEYTYTFQTYTEAQFKSLLELVKKLLNRYNLKKNVSEDNFKVLVDKTTLRSVLFASNVDSQSLSPNPTFNFDVFREYLT